MKYKKLFEAKNDNLHQMPVDHLHAETHNTFAGLGYKAVPTEFPGALWKFDMYSEQGWTHPNKLAGRLRTLGWKKPYSAYSNENRGVLKHPNGSVLSHSGSGWRFTPPREDK